MASFIKSNSNQMGYGDEANVATPNIPYNVMSDKWKLIETLRGGTEAMRSAGKTYLPQEPRESNEAWEFRLQRTFLYNLYLRTIQSLVGMAFIKPIVMSGVPKELEYLEFNADGNGRSISEMAYEMAFDCVHYGLVHGMCDFPSTGEKEMSLAEFRANGFLPYFTHINPTNLIGWRTEHKPGIPMLEQVRIVENIMIPSDLNEWSDKLVNYVKVVRNDYTEIYEFDTELNEDTGYELTDVVQNTLGYIPLTTAYSNKTGFMTGEPTLYDLAMVNLRHYQSSSDQNNILHVARVPFIHASGFEEGELENMEIGANRMVVSTNPDSAIKYVEHTGKAIASGRQDLQDLEQQMATLGADMLISKGVGRMTATARKIDQTESASVLQMTLRSVEQMIEQLYLIAGDWLGIDASAVSVSIGDDLSTANEPNPTNALVTLLNSGLLTDEQVVEEAKRQGILSSYFKIAEGRPRAQEGFGEAPVEKAAPEDSEEPEENVKDEPEEDIENEDDKEE